MQATMENGEIKVEFDVGQVNKDILSFLSLLETSSKSKASDEEIWKRREKNDVWLQSSLQFLV